MTDHYDPLQFDHLMRKGRAQRNRQIVAERQYSPLVIRAFAYITDILIVIVFSTIVPAIFGLMLYIIYFIFIPAFSHKQGTLRQQMMGLHVVRKDPSKSTNFLHHTLRAIAMPLSILPLGAGLWMALFNKENMTFHDWVSGTRVVSSKL